MGQNNQILDFKEWHYPAEKIHEISWKLMKKTLKFSWKFMKVHERSWMFMNIHENARC